MITILLTVLCAKRIFGSVKALTVLLFFALSLPFYTIAPVFYTDSLSLVFPILVLYLYLRMTDCGKIHRKVLIGFLLCITCAVGIMVKFTVVIVLIAIALYELFQKRLKRAVSISLCAGVTILAVSLTFNAYFKSVHLDREQLNRLRIPYSHWVMMSLSGSGVYNRPDYDFTMSFDDPELRDKAIMQVIGERIRALGVKGLFKLMINKSIIAFGDGTFAQSDFLDDNPQNERGVHKWLLYSGEHYSAYKLLASGTFFGILLLMLGSAYQSLFLKRRFCLIPHLCSLGIFLFLMLWEVTGRYMTNYIPMFFLAAASFSVPTRKRT
jgi:hypothetical protein